MPNKAYGPTLFDANMSNTMKRTRVENGYAPSRLSQRKDMESRQVNEKKRGRNKKNERQSERASERHTHTHTHALKFKNVYLDMWSNK